MSNAVRSRHEAPGLLVEQHYLGCLSQASYLVADTTTGRAIVVDPRRDVEDYLVGAVALGFTIELVVLTHVHADFVPGNSELTLATGAPVAMGEASPVTFPIRRLGDGERILLGDADSGVAVEVIATPGHTPESITLAVFRQACDDEPFALLTGDTLFLGDVGRPDLLGAVGRTPAQMARELYRSLHERILPLPDHVLVLPGHGAGSACGKELSTETVSTLGEQRRENYALAPMDEATFVEVVTEGLAEPPAYFAEEVAINRVGHEVRDTRPPANLEGAQAVQRATAGELLLDVRDDQSFASGHLRGAVNVGLEGRFAEYAGAVHEPGQPVILVGTAEDVVEARVRLARIGVDDVVAVVTTAARALAQDPTLGEVASRLTAEQARKRLSGPGPIQVVDVRGPAEHALGALPGSVNLPLPRLREDLGALDPAVPVLVHCAGGYRSSAAASLLRSRGFSDVSDLLGGWAAWQAGQRPTS
jgi:hydroxyacylglutathione hydrolase